MLPIENAEPVRLAIFEPSLEQGGGIEEGTEDFEEAISGLYSCGGRHYCPWWRSGEDGKEPVEMNVSGQRTVEKVS